MKGIIVLLVLFCLGVSARPENYIHGGNEAGKFETPFIVSIQFSFPPNYYHVCGGVILTPVWVLTSGQCIDASIRTDVLTGKHDLLVYEEGQQRRGIQIRSTSATVDGNLGLIHLASKLNYDVRTNNIGISNLIDANPGDVANFVAWPFRHPTNTEMTHQLLQRASFQVMTEERCNAMSTRKVDYTNEFCTAESDGNLSGSVATCRGSEGSPLYTLKFGRPVVLGILIEAPSSCNNATNQPTGVFARVAAYRRWISRITEQ